jgi:cysteine desulfurase
MARKIYLDYAASTPVDPNVFAAMQPYFTEKFGNPGSLHSFGQEAIAAVDKSREIIAKSIGAEFREIVFTASATEANNLVLRGVAHPVRRSTITNPKIIVSAIEHESVLETVRDLEQEGVEAVFCPVDANGVINLEALKTAIDDRTILVSVMYANNEVGTIEPIQKISEIVHEFRRVNREKNAAFPLLHVDAAQAFQFLDCNVSDLSGANGLGVDFMTISSHKIYGPKGAGALYVRNQKMLMPLFAGGGQEFGIRSGTENVPAIVGFAKAAELIASTRDAEGARIGNLRNTLWAGIKQIVPDAEINGPSENCLPNLLNVYFPGHEAQDLLTKFDLAGLATASGSACHSRALEPSYVVAALGLAGDRAASSIRFSLGRPTTDEDIAETIKIINETFSKNTS